MRLTSRRGFVAGLWKCAEWCQTLAGRHGWSSVPKSSGNWMRGMLRDEAAGEKEDVAVRATFRRLMREARRCKRLCLRGLVKRAGERSRCANRNAGGTWCSKL